MEKQRRFEIIKGAIKFVYKIDFSGECHFIMWFSLNNVPSGIKLESKTYFKKIAKMKSRKQKTPKNVNSSVFYWRRERDLNPWYSCPYTRFPGVLLRPLGHLSSCFQRVLVYHFCRYKSRKKSINFQIYWFWKTKRHSRNLWWSLCPIKRKNPL